MSDTPEVRPVNAGLERRRLLYVLSEALEKLSRLRKILKSQRDFVAAQHAEGEPTTAVDTLVAYLDNHCQTFLDSSDLFALLLA